LNKNQAFKQLEHIRQSVETYEFKDKPELQVTLSFGLSTVNMSDNIDTAVKKADTLLYQAKANGRNRIEL